jgi:hypothetical protein
VTGQEDLLIAFQELFKAPTARHVFSFALAAFIDIIVFLLALASGHTFWVPPNIAGWLHPRRWMDWTSRYLYVVF